jgi:hypothetical protein
MVPVQEVHKQLCVDPDAEERRKKKGESQA